MEKDALKDYSLTDKLKLYEELTEGRVKLERRVGKEREKEGGRDTVGGRK